MDNFNDIEIDSTTADLLDAVSKAQNINEIKEILQPYPEILDAYLKELEENQELLDIKEAEVEISFQPKAEDLPFKSEDLLFFYNKFTTSILNQNTLQRMEIKLLSDRIHDIYKVTYNLASWRIMREFVYLIISEWTVLEDTKGVNLEIKTTDKPVSINIKMNEDEIDEILDSLTPIH